MGRKAKDLTGQKFGKLTVIKRAHSHGNSKSIYWLCYCDCGNKDVEVRGSCLTSGHTTSCGCYISERLTKVNTRHGGFGTRLYNIWQGMKKRCYKENDKDYKNYGGRGIQIYDEWKEDFACFREWALNNGYQDNLTIDRVDNNKNYEPSNCRWTTIQIQNNNRRNNKLLTIGNKTQTMAEWGRELNISDDTISSRLFNGWTCLEALEIVKHKTIKKQSISPITYEGRTMTLTEWAKERNIHRNTLSSRLHNGWSIEEALEYATRKHNEIKHR